MTDTQRLDWLLDLVSLGDDEKTDAKSLRLAGAMMLGRTGRDAIDTAMGAVEPLDPHELDRMADDGAPPHDSHNNG